AEAWEWAALGVIILGRGHYRTSSTSTFNHVPGAFPPTTGKSTGEGPKRAATRCSLPEGPNPSSTIRANRASDSFSRLQHATSRPPGASTRDASETSLG